MKLGILLTLATLLCCCAAVLRAQNSDAEKQRARDIFKQLIEINTTDSIGSTTTAAEAMAQRLHNAGFSATEAQVLGPNPRKGNLVARLRGTGARRPILLMGHLDVVEARREEWSVDPFQFLERDGYFYGRGTQDMKSADAIFVASLIRFREEGYRPDRDIILMLTADEESGKSNGVEWLLQNHRDLIDAEFALNPDGGGVYTRNGKPAMMSVDASEKLYADYQLEVNNPGGHSSLPVPDNAIYHLSDGLARIERHQFPFELNGVTRAYFQKMAAIETGQVAADMKAITKKSPDAAAIARLDADPLSHATMRTTCVATRLDAGHANNALPQTAHAIVNCRILPGHTSEEVRLNLIQVLDDPKIAVRYVSDAGEILEAAPNEPSGAPVALRPEVMKPLEKVAEVMWPGVPVIPTMATGASDGVFTNGAGIPTYAISGLAVDFDDVRAHGRDERLRVDSFFGGLDFYERFLKALTSQQ
jgi:acetylornithine deacetylase/succinyl-diaminopimelate desuccinylase-like protein